MTEEGVLDVDLPEVSRDEVDQPCAVTHTNSIEDH